MHMVLLSTEANPIIIAPTTNIQRSLYYRCRKRDVVKYVYRRNSVCIEFVPHTRRPD